MKFEIAAKSLIGKREDQQDSYIYRTGGVTMAAVCDGMGGLEGGALASKTATLTFKEDIKENFPISDYPAFLADEVNRVDRAVYELKGSDGKKLDAGTTIVSVIIDDDKMFFMTVGDSRIYMKRQNEMLPINREHNYKLQLDSYLREGAISREDYEKEMVRGGHLISYIGMGDVVIKDINQNPIRLESEDMLLLCTDGLTKTLTDAEIMESLSKNKTVDETVNLIEIKIAEKNLKNQDNVTFVLLKAV